jgi:hypothetical protein
MGDKRIANRDRIHKAFKDNMDEMDLVHLAHCLLAKGRLQFRPGTGEIPRDAGNGLPVLPHRQAIATDARCYDECFIPIFGDWLLD